ncbi:DUF6897 domain-containing protein [Bacillus sp. FJAT-28004]|uniref:DUF6897 domain-containing protein n=1 Tax=Bacillus sp. FJAT-28004 TaxID=1679165 RepID=UPI0006B40191|nr:DUF2642 domain-containing protein [Bacillus sp. FJAT-28004]
MSLWYNNRYSTGQSGSNDYNHHKSGSNDSNFVQSLVGKNVKVNRGGPESLQGKLHSVKSDYLVLVTNEGVVYIANSHVKSVTEVGGKNTSGGNKSGNGNRSGGRNLGIVNANNFNGVIRALNQTFVQLNSGGPEKVEGFLAQAGNSSVLLVNGREVMQIQNFHIKSIKAAGNQSGGNNNNKNENKNNNKNENKSDNKNDNKNKSDNKNNNKNKTQGNRSGGRGNATRSSVK